MKQQPAPAQPSLFDPPAEPPPAPVPLPQATVRHGERMEPAAQPLAPVQPSAPRSESDRDRRSYAGLEQYLAGER